MDFTKTLQKSGSGRGFADRGKSGLIREINGSGLYLSRTDTWEIDMDPNQDCSWLTIAHALSFSSPYLDISVLVLCFVFTLSCLLNTHSDGVVLLKNKVEHVFLKGF